MADNIRNLTIEQLASAMAAIRDLANSGVCEPDEISALWRIADRVDAAVAAKRGG